MEPMRPELLLQRRGFRVLGIDDGPFVKGQDEPVLVVCPVVRGGGQLDGLLTTTVQRDGFDATERLVARIGGSKFLPQLHYLMLSGITFGGFNVVDLPRLAAELGCKLLAVMRRPPDLPRMLEACGRLPEPERRRELIRRAGPIHRLEGLCCQLHGLGTEEAAAVLQVTCTVGHFPEPLRLAHVIASGVVLGESGNNRP